MEQVKAWLEWILERVGWEKLETMNVENSSEFYSLKDQENGAIVGGGYKVSKEDVFL